ncbi:RagB/SusD family nutrient uptake outer membrane protein [Odoribacter sp. AF15-53]|uniref:RagB/SusD family nutrient uptake outer membrane protein n=1 Tax=Odoribacter sp. AF15-53 TaxID=2292236 RepID=UPI000E54541E|nr:RagB/SusD family nutrient uptake outer membrane protein [Odoribacter sp. AF15-53]RHR78383.1 hypothetical protein DWW52_12285 [Odoribacter sp. AF15-53]
MNICSKIIVIFCCVGLCACADWLDLKPETDATETDVFSTGEGYRSVLNGLYKSMGSGSLYGIELGFGIVDCMSQQYDLEKMTAMSLNDPYIAAGAYKYTDVSLIPVLEGIWKSAFNVIANANNLIQNIQDESPDLFQLKEREKSVILGEAYACRALMHFDMLRLFAPAPVNDDGKSYVPYVEKYPDIQADAIAVKPFLNKVIADLEYARELVAVYDTTDVGIAASATGEKRFYAEGFFNGRGYRLSYYSISALLARVYQYADRHEDAFRLAEEVMKFELKGKSFYGDVNFNGVMPSTFEAKTDLKIVSNLIFAVYNEKQYTDNKLTTFFKKENDSDNKTWLVVNSEKQELFYNSQGDDESNLDYRSKYMIYLAGGQFPVSGKWYCSDDELIRERNVTILPVIRATEMQYIMAEYYAREQNYVEAYRILNEIRSDRGCVVTIDGGASWDGFVKELILDARREWISEGQLFYLYKRLNADIEFNRAESRPLKREEYLVPVPADQFL